MSVGETFAVQSRSVVCVEDVSDDMMWLVEGWILTAGCSSLPAECYSADGGVMTFNDYMIIWV
jgi:hypothetical protein